VKKTDTIFDELDHLHQAISRRAYEFFNNGRSWGDALANWLNAERELIAKPAIEVRQTDGEFEVMAALPGLAAKDLDVQVTPEYLLIKAETKRESTSDKGTVHVSEFSRAQVFRSIRFPERIDPDRVKTEFKNGMLTLTASIAKAATTTKKVEIKAA
jgi:HSP20 family molecular chaperone IbpA